MMTPDDILSRPYRRVLAPDEAGGYTATIHEFPGCVASGKNAKQAVQNLEAAARDWVLAALETGYPIAEPMDYDDFSGKFALRLSRRLHKMAAEQAELEGTSLNQMLNIAVASYLGQRDGLNRAAHEVRHVAATIAYATRNYLVQDFEPVARSATTGRLPSSPVRGISFDFSKDHALAVGDA